MVRCSRLVTLITLAGAVAGCGSVRPPAARPAAPGAAANVPARAPRSAPCVAEVKDGWGVPMPAGFVPVAAVRCVETDRIIAGHGRWRVQLRQVATRGLDRLATAFRQPSARRPLTLICALPKIVVPVFVLVGRDGQVIRPKAPTDACGQPQPEAVTAMRALRWTTVSARRVVQIETEAGIRAGCPPGWKDVFGLMERVPKGGLRYRAGHGPVFGVRPAWLRVCVYRDRRGTMDTYLIGGGRVSGAAETGLLRGISSARAAAACPLPHDTFAIVQPPGRMAFAVAYVEIGGCHRVLRPDNRIGQASQAALAIISRSTGSRL